MALTATLEWYEQLLAVEVGCRRRIEARRRNRTERHPPADPINGWFSDINGAAGELAYAKATGKFWCGSVDTFQTPDVGRAEIRTTYRALGVLSVRPDAKDDARYVLVTGTMPDFVIVGYIVAADAKRAEWMHDNGNGDPVYRVPQDALVVPS